VSERKIAPSEKLTKAIEELVGAAEQDGSGLLRELASLGARRLIQEALEREQGEYLGEPVTNAESRSRRPCTATATSLASC